MLKSNHRIALTGTPIENHLSDLWSIFDFLCPGLLGSLKQFQTFVKSFNSCEDNSKHIYAPLRKLVSLKIFK